MKTIRELINLIETAQTPEQQYKIYFVIPEHDDYDDRHEPTETTIVTASSANEAGKKFRAEVPEAYIEQIVPLNYNQGVAEGQLDELSPQTLKSYLKKSKGHSQKYDNLGTKAIEKHDEKLASKMWNKSDNRDAGQTRARSTLAKKYPGLEYEVNEQEDENQEYTVRVVDEEGSGYTVKVTATSEQGALHKAIVKVRNSGARPEHARIIRQDVEEQATPEAIARIEQLSSK